LLLNTLKKKKEVVTRKNCSHYQFYFTKSIHSCYQLWDVKEK